MELVTNSVEAVQREAGYPTTLSPHASRTHTRKRLPSLAPCARTEGASVDTELSLSSGEERGYRTDRPRPPRGMASWMYHRAKSCLLRFFYPFRCVCPSVLFAKWETQKSGGGDRLGRRRHRRRRGRRRVEGDTQRAHARARSAVDDDVRRRHVGCDSAVLSGPEKKQRRNRSLVATFQMQPARVAKYELDNEAVFELMRCVSGKHTVESPCNDHPSNYPECYQEPTTLASLAHFPVAYLPTATERAKQKYKVSSIYYQPHLD